MVTKGDARSLDYSSYDGWIKVINGNWSRDPCVQCLQRRVWGCLGLRE